MADTLINARGETLEDRWIHLADDEAAPSEGALLLSLSRWQGEADTLRQRAQPLGLRLANTVDPAELGEAIHAFALIVLEFPQFMDGRAFSQARILRDRLGFSGELRAAGDIAPDQLFYLRRCGFDSFAVPSPPAKGLDKFLQPFSQAYQPGARRPEQSPRG